MNPVQFLILFKYPFFFPSSILIAPTHTLSLSVFPAIFTMCYYLTPTPPRDLSSPFPSLPFPLQSRRRILTRLPQFLCCTQGFDIQGCSSSYSLTPFSVEHPISFNPASVIDNSQATQYQTHTSRPRSQHSMVTKPRMEIEGFTFTADAVNVSAGATMS